MPWAFSNVSSRLIPSAVEELPSTVSYSNHPRGLNDGDDELKHRGSGTKSAVDTADLSSFPENHATVMDQGYFGNNSTHSLKYSSHHLDEKDDEDNHDDDDDSLSLVRHTAGAAADYHPENYGMQRINTQFRSYPLGTFYHQHRLVDKNDIFQETKSPPLHERSRSVDYVDYLDENEQHKYPGLLRSLSEVFKSPRRYGATSYTPYLDDSDSVMMSPLVTTSDRRVMNQNKSGGTFTSTPDTDRDDSSLDKLDPMPPTRKKRSMRRRIYVLLTDPHSSILSALTTAVIFFMIIGSNIVMVLQTLDQFEYTPSNCRFCDEYYERLAADDMGVDRFLARMTKCTCPPKTIPTVAKAENFIMCFFAVEWLVRLICFEPLREKDDPPRNLLQSLFDFYFEPHSVMDLLAFLPYFVEKYAARDTFMSFRLMRIFRVFQLIRLGQYNLTFCTLVNVLISSLPSINMLGIALIFGGVFFGTVVYWLERGEWKYTDLLDPPGFAHVRIGKDGLTEELSPFRSIPGSFWWFIVTVTTVGYGDMVPTSPLGKIVGSCAMLVGVLVIAFPVSVFSELWSKELKANGAYRSVDDISTREDDFENMNHSLGQDDDDDDDRVVPPKIISAVVDRSDMEDDNHFVPRDDASVHSIVFQPEGSLPFSPEVKMEMTNVQAIRHYMSVIDDAQQKIQSLLEKIDASGSSSQ
jgi:hypothetical protein